MDPSLMMDIKTNITLGLLIIENGTHKGYQHVVVPQNEDLKDEDGKTPLLSWWQLTRTMLLLWRSSWATALNSQVQDEGAPEETGGHQECCH